MKKRKTRGKVEEGKRERNQGKIKHKRILTSLPLERNKIKIKMSDSKTLMKKGKQEEENTNRIGRGAKRR